MSLINGIFILHLIIFRCQGWLIKWIFRLIRHDNTVMYHYIVEIFIARLIFILKITIHYY